MVDVRALSTAATALCVGVALAQAQREKVSLVIDSKLAALIEEIDAGESYITRLGAELLAAIHAGRRARIQ